MNRSDRGLSLLETLVAVTIAAAGVFSVGAVAFLATTTSKNQGTEATRATIYAQDKLEGLMALAAVATASSTVSWSGCTQSNSTQQATYASCNTSGISATGWYTGLLAGGQTSPLQTSCPSGASVGYMDFLDVYGNQIQQSSCSAAYTSSTKIGYIRQWQITDANSFGSTPALKQVTVAVYSMSYVATVGPQPVVVLSAYVSNPN
jgi:Tfp pilus assembly protein PilV